MSRRAEQAWGNGRRGKVRARTWGHRGQRCMGGKAGQAKDWERRVNVLFAKEDGRPKL